MFVWTGCTLTLDEPLDGHALSTSTFVLTKTVGEKNIVGNRFSWTEVVQFFANTYGGVVADNTFSDCNVVAAGGDGSGACQATGLCYNVRPTVCRPSYSYLSVFVFAAVC